MMQNNKLKLKTKHQEENIKSLNKILQSRDSTKVENELIQKNQELMEQLERFKRQVIKMKIQNQKFDQRQKLTNKLKQKNPSEVSIDLAIKKSNLQQQISFQEQRMSTLRVTGTTFRITEQMSRQDRKTNLDNYLKERQSTLNDQDAIMDFVETEVEVTRNANNIQYLKMIEQMEENIKEFENDKNLLLEENTGLKLDLEKMTEKYKNQNLEKKEIQQKIENLLIEHDEMKFNYESNNKKIIKLNKEIEKMKKEQEKHQKENDNQHDKQISMLKKKLDQIETEKDVFQGRLKKALNDKTNNQDLQNIQNQQIVEHEKKIINLESSNEKISNACEEMKKKLKEKENEIKIYKENYQKIQEESLNQQSLLEIKFNNKIQQLENQVKLLEDQKLNFLAKDEQNDLDEHIMGRLSELQDFDDYNRDSYMLNKESRLPELKMSNLQDLEVDIELNEQNQEDLNLLEDLKEKDQEITKLRKELCELRAKQTDQKKIQELKEISEKLKLEKNQLQEEKEHLEKSSKSKIQAIEKQNDLFLENLQKTKMEYFDYIADNDQKISKLRHQIKVLNKTIEAYQNEIDLFNKKMKKKKQLN